MSKGLGYYVGGALFVVGSALAFIPGVGQTLQYIGYSLMVSGAMNAAGAALAPRPAGGSGGFNRSGKYGFDRSTNLAIEGSPRPTVLGQEIVTPPYIWAYTEQDGKTQTLHAGFFLSTGGTYGIEDVRRIWLNDTPLEHFSDVAAYWKKGTSTQTATEWYEYSSGTRKTITCPEKVGIPFDKNVTFQNEGESLTHGTHTEVDEVAVVMAWYSGLFGVSGGGKQETSGWRGQVEYRELTGTTWGDWTRLDAPKDKKDDWKRDGNGVWKVEGRTRGQKRMVMRLVWTSKKRREIKITALNASDSKDTRNATVVRIEEIRSNDSAYAGSAILYIKAVAEAQLSGTFPRVDVEMRGWKVKNLGDSAAAWTQNPAKLLYAWLTDTNDGCGRWIAESDIDTETTGTWRNGLIYHASVPGTGAHYEPRHHLDLVIDSMQSATDWIGHIESTCRVKLAEWGGKIRYLYDHSGSSTATFDGRQQRDTDYRPILMDKDGRVEFRQAEVPASQRPTHVRALYYDERDKYERRWTDEVADPDWASTDPKVMVELSLQGVTRESQALRECRYVINDARYRPRVYQLGVGIGDLNLLPFDIITVYLDSPSMSGTELQVLGVQYRADHTALLTCRDYSASVYSDTSDTLQSRAASLTRSSALEKARKIPSGATNVKVKEVAG